MDLVFASFQAILGVDSTADLLSPLLTFRSACLYDFAFFGFAPLSLFNNSDYIIRFCYIFFGVNISTRPDDVFCHSYNTTTIENNELDMSG